MIKDTNLSQYLVKYQNIFLSIQMLKNQQILYFRGSNERIYDIFDSFSLSNSKFETA